jgi:DNA-binding response OmpR family regulator
LRSAKKILVVDDEIDSNPSLKLVFEENGFKVDVFKDPLSALEKIKTNLYDLLIIDTRNASLSCSTSTANAGLV